ncbi:MAG: ribulokinase [Candidatus Omnitrophica bacterium]|nr:ribulokinase [Candidatus Omnitrophota bacterium]
MRYSLGIDFGTASVRAVLVDIETGEEVVTGVENYPSGIEGVITDEKDPYLARQNPLDYHISLEKVLRGLSLSIKKKKIKDENIIGIGIDTTGSTPIPVDRNIIPLSFHKAFRNNKNAMAWLWKDHTSKDEAEEITLFAKKKRPEYLLKIGGVYSSEWFFSKILHLSRVDKRVFDASASFVELCDYIPAILTGKKNPGEILRSTCAAGHKAMYNKGWGGLPDDKFLTSLSPAFKGLREKLYLKAYPAGVCGGLLCKEWAKKSLLPEGLPISVGGFDAHMGAVGAGIKENTLVKIMGTSTCDMMISSYNKDISDIPGLCGIVPDSIVPGYFGMEAGQSAVGDIFYWFVKTFLPQSKSLEDPYEYYSKIAEKISPGGSGLLALDWQNGNRTVLMDQKLTGLIVGLTLNTKPRDVYRALVEATGFGARTIIERFEEYGIKVKDIIASGGLPEKSPFLMQVYADITGRELKTAASGQTCAVGAAIFGAVADKEKSGISKVEKIQEKICRFKNIVYRPVQKNKKIYDRIYLLYKEIHDAFGTGTYDKSIYNVMKELLKIKEEHA